MFQFKKAVVNLPFVTPSGQVRSYLDDVIILAANQEEGLKRVLNVVSEHKLEKMSVAARKNRVFKTYCRKWKN